MRAVEPSSALSRFWVTCYTDASFGRTGAGWGVWLRSVAGRVVRRGACPDYVASSLEAELSAIFAGVYLSRRTWGDRVRGVLVRTDCQIAIDLLTAASVKERTLRRHPGAARLREKILALAKEHAVEIEYGWVKGHQKTNTVQAYLNRACDSLAAAARGSGARPTPAVTAVNEARPHAAERAANPPAPEANASPAPRSRKEKNRARRARARARKRAKKRLDAAAPTSPPPLENRSSASQSAADTGSRTGHR